METTTVRVHKTTREKLRRISTSERVSITDLIDKLVEEHEGSFWRGFDAEAVTFLDEEERKTREIFDGALEDGLTE